MFKRESSILIALFLLANLIFFSYAYLSLEQNQKMILRIDNLEAEIEEQKNKGNEENIEKKITYIEESKIIDTVDQVKEGVVSIIATKDVPKLRRRNYFFDDFFFNDPFDMFFNDPFRERGVPEKEKDTEDEESEKMKIGGGSGFIYSKEGLVITNKHVVSDKDAYYTIILFDGTEFDAEVLARDDFNDLAVLKIKDLKDIELNPLSLGDSKNIQVGQRVVAIGNALAEFENTVTTGIISAKGRSIVASDGYSQGEQISNLLQTDAAINPGNSGGPLVNLNGEVIGINTAIAQNANGIGFAIPINDVKVVAQTVLKHGKIIRPFIGIRYVLLNEEIAKQFNLEIKEGALIKGYSDKEPGVLKGSPADIAGLKEGDIIIKIDNQEINNKNDIRTIVAQKGIGDKIKVKVLREEEEKTFDLILGNKEEVEKLQNIKEQ
jgi:serine protease Do